MTTINQEHKDNITRLLDLGKTKDQVEGYLLLEGVPKKEALAYLKEIGLIGAQTFRGWLHATAKRGYISPEEFDAKIAGESSNVRNHYKPYDNERIFANSIHAIYSGEIADRVASESDREAPEATNGAASGPIGGDNKFKAPRKPSTTKGLYKKLIQGSHPDRNSSYWAEEFTKKINLAQDDKYTLDVLWDEYVANLKYDYEV